MRRIFIRIVSIALMLSMLLSMFVVMTVSAETAQAENEKLENLYVFEGSGIPASTVNGDFSDQGGVWKSSTAIPVAEGDVIYWGLCDAAQQWYIAKYDSTGARKGTVGKGDKIGVSSAVVHETVNSSRVILKWEVPANITHIRVTTRVTDRMIITKNQPLSYDAYLNTNWDELINWYELEGPGIPSDTLNGEFTDQNGLWKGSTAIPVTAGDVIYWGIGDATQKWYIAKYDSTGARKGTVGKGDEIGDSSAVIHETVANNQVILKWKVPANITHIRVTTRLSEPMVVTKNQALDYKGYLEVLSRDQSAYNKYLQKLAKEMNNLYEVAGIGIPVGNVNAPFDETSGYVGSEVIAVAEGDNIYFGACNLSQKWHIATFDANGIRLTQVSKADAADSYKAVLYDTITSTRGVLKWTVPSGVAQIRLTTNVTDYDMIVTKNQPLFADLYQKVSGTVVENKYQPSSLGIPNGPGIGDVLFDQTSYVAAAPIEVQSGDKIYFGPCNSTQKWFIATYAQDGSKLGSSAMFSNSTTYDVLSDTESILCWTVPSGVAKIRLTTFRTYAKTTVITVNQPFGECAYNDYILNFTKDNYGYGEVTEGSPLEGLNGLFMGDSITAGSYDLMAPSQGRSWAGRIAADTGLKITNAGVGGSSIAYNSNDPRWIFDQYTANKNNAYDVVVMGGGVNDARRNLAVGSILDSEDPATLEVNKTTYAGGLQWLFYNVKNNWSDAKLFYIANFRLDGCTTGSAQDMSAYFAVAKQLCQKYDVVYIDLYGNAELNAKLAPTTVTYLPDLLHPTSEGYDIITPYIQDAIENEIMQSLLTVQVNLHQTQDRIRLLTTVDDLDYEEVGYIITRASDGRVAKASTTSVFSSVMVDMVQQTPEAISGYARSKYIAAIEISNIPSGEKFSVQSYVICKDSSIVYGESVEVTMP